MGNTVMVLAWWYFWGTGEEIHQTNITKGNNLETYENLFGGI